MALHHPAGILSLPKGFFFDIIAETSVLPIKDLTYDAWASGGTTGIELDAQGNGGHALGRLVDLRRDRGAGGETRDKNHGYVFEVSPVQGENVGTSPCR